MEENLKLLSLLNKLVEVVDIDVESLRKNFPAKDLEGLRSLKEDFPWFSISREGTPDEGVSILSILNTFVQYYSGECGIGVRGEDGIASGFFLNYLDVEKDFD